MLLLLSCILILLLSIFLGARLGGLGIAFASGLGLFLFTMVLGIAPGTIPINVVLIIVAVIGAIAVLELSGGLAYMVSIAEKILRKNPKQINFLAPVVSFVMTVLSGTGHTAYSVIPVIVEVAKEQGIKPVRPLTSAVVASQIAITASPITAAVVGFLGILEPYGITMIQLLMIVFPSTFIACMLMAFVQRLLPQDLNSDPYYLANKSNMKTVNKRDTVEITKASKISVVIFLSTILLIVTYGLFPNLKPVYANGSKIDSALLIVILMLLGAYVMVLLTKVKVSELANQSTFKAGMSAALCVIGVAWLGDTLITHYKEPIKAIAGDFLADYPWTFSIILFFMATLLYSQSATTVAIMPLGVALGLAPDTLIASFAAVSALFVLPTYPTLIAAVQMDYTGTTRMGKYVFDHPFMIPGVLAIVFSVVLGYIFAGFVL